MRPFANQRSTPALRVAALAIALVLQIAPASALSPEEEITRLNRVRQNLFEELVKTRAEAAAARAELEAVTRARDEAEAELTRLRQEAAAVKPVDLPSTAAIPAGPPVGEDPARACLTVGCLAIICSYSQWDVSPCLGARCIPGSPATVG